MGRKCLFSAENLILIGMALSLLRIPFKSLGAEKYRIVTIPKLIGIDYYSAVKDGIDEAVSELPDVEVTWIGPTLDRVEKQITPKKNKINMQVVLPAMLFTKENVNNHHL